MTIHDILVNCGSIRSDTLIIILDGNGEGKWVGAFMNLPKECEELKIKYFIVDFHIYENTLRTYFKFYV